MKTFMNTKKETLFSTLWIFVTLNYLYCDVVGLMDHRLMSQYLKGTVNGFEINENFLLSGAVLMEIPIAMVILSRLLAYTANRWANIAAGSIKTVIMVLTMFVATPKSYYLFFGSIEIVTTIVIVWYAWNWAKSEEATVSI